MSAGSPSGRRITVRSVSCRGVKSFVPFQKPPLYVAVSLGGRREKAPADPDGGDNPDWDGAVFAFDFDGAGAGHDGLLQFEVKAQVPLLGNKLVGTTCVPASHLSGGGGDVAAPQRVSYQVLAPDGKPNGSLSFVYAVTGGGAYQQPAAPNGARPEQDLSFCCTPPTPPSSLAYPHPATPNFGPPSSSYPSPPSSSPYPPPATPNFAPPGGSYPPPPSSSAYPPPAMPNFAPPGSSYPPPAASTSLYPPLQGMLPPSDYPPPPQMMDSLFPASNSGLNSSYPPPLTAAYPPTPASSAYYPVPSTQHFSSSYPPPPPSGYPPPQMSPEFPAPASSYPPPPPPESRSVCSVLPRSMPSPVPRSVDRELPSMAPWFQDSVITYPALPGPPVHSGGSYYPPSGLRHHEDGATSPYYYPHPHPHPHPGARYSYE